MAEKQMTLAEVIADVKRQEAEAKAKEDAIIGRLAEQTRAKQEAKRKAEQASQAAREAAAEAAFEARARALFNAANPGGSAALYAEMRGEMRKAVMQEDVARIAAAKAQSRRRYQQTF